MPRRKNPHLPQFHKKANGHREPLGSPQRRKHGIFSNLAPSPSAMCSAEKRKHLYLHKSRTA